MAPAVKSVLERVNTFLGSLSAWIDRHPVLARNIGMTVLSLATLLSVVGGGALILGKLSMGLLGAGKAFLAVAGWAGTTGRYIWDTGRALVTFTKYAGSLRGGLAALARIQFPGLTKLAGQLGRLIPVIWSNVVASWAWIKAWASSPIQTLKYLGTMAWGSFMKLLPAVWANVSAAWAWTAALLANPITWIVAGAVALGAAAYLVIKHWDKVKAWFVGLWNWFKGLLNKTPDWVLALVLPGTLAIKHWDKVKAWFAGLWTWLKGIFAKGRPFLELAMLGPVGIIIKHWDKIKPAFTALWAWLKGMGKKFKDAGLNIVKAIWEGMMGAASKPVEAIKSIVAKVRRFLPFSPAKEGPLRDIHRIRLVETIAGSIKADPLVSAMRNVMGQAVGALGLAAAPMAAAAGVPVLHPTQPPLRIELTYAPTIKIDGAAPANLEAQLRELLAKDRDEMLRQLQRAMETRERTKLK
jgi:hypothetical protein